MKKNFYTISKTMSRSLKLILFSVFIGFSIFLIPQPTWAYPFWAQQKFEILEKQLEKLFVLIVM